MSQGWVVLPLAVLGVGAAGYAYLCRKWNGEAEKRVFNYSELQKDVSKIVLKNYRLQISESRERGDFEKDFSQKITQDTKLFYKQNGLRIPHSVLEELSKAGGIENYVRQTVEFLVNDFYKVLDHEAIVLSRTLATTLTVDQEMKINMFALKRGQKNFLMPSLDSSYNKMLHDFERGTSDYQLLVDAMVRDVTEDHQDFVMKKAKEIGSVYYAAIDKTVENLMKQGSQTAQVSPFSIQNFESDDYFGAIAVEYFPDDSAKKSQVLVQMNKEELPKFLESQEDLVQEFGIQPITQDYVLGQGNQSLSLLQIS